MVMSSWLGSCFSRCLAGGDKEVRCGQRHALQVQRGAGGTLSGGRMAADCEDHLVHPTRVPLLRHGTPAAQSAQGAPTRLAPCQAPE